MSQYSYIHKLIADGESDTLDFKYNINDSRKIARSMVAFANGRGGRLLIGVRDNGSIAGVSSEEEIFMLEAAAEYYSKPTIKPEIREWQVNGKTILEVHILESQSKPHYAKNEDDKWRAYIRVNDNDLLAEKVLLKLWKIERQQKPAVVKYRKKEAQLMKILNNVENLSFRQIQKDL